MQRPAGAGGAAQCAGGRRGLIGRVAAAVGGAPFNFRVPMRTGQLHSEAASPSSPNLPELAPAAFRGDGLYIEGQHTRWGASWVARTGTEWRWRLGCERPTTTGCPSRRVDIFPSTPSRWTVCLFVYLQGTNIDEPSAFVLQKHERWDERTL